MIGRCIISSMQIFLSKRVELKSETLSVSHSRPCGNNIMEEHNKRHARLDLKDARSVSFRSELFTSYILAIFKQRNLLP